MSKLSFHYAILSIITHASFILLASIPGWRAAPLVSGDSVSYMMDAENILRHGVFSREKAAPYLWEPYRTPGYPLLLSFSQLITGNAESALFFAAIGAGLAAWVAVRMVTMFGGGRVSQHIAGLGMAVLPNSLGLSAFLLTDAMFGYLFLFWIYLLYMGFSKESKPTLILSAIILFVLQAIKPTSNLGILFIIEFLVLFVHQWKDWYFASLLVVLALLVPIIFSIMNYRDNGIFSPTLLDVQTVREYLQVRYLAEQTGQEIDQVAAQVRLQDYKSAELLSEPESLYGRIYLVKQAEVKRFVMNNPLRVLRLIGSEMIIQFAAPQEFAWLVFWNRLPIWVRALGSLLTLALWLGAGLGAWLLVRQGNRHLGWILVGVLAFFLVTGSVSHYVGARLRFSADLVAIPYFSYGISIFLSNYFHVFMKPK